MIRRAHSIFIGLVVSTFACGAPSDVDEGAAWRTDPATRRAALEAALWRPELKYSRGLLGNYALLAGGWELLPELTTDAAPFGRADADRLIVGTLDLDTSLPTDEPEDEDAWLALGARVFAELPMRSDPYLTWLAANPERWDEAGLSVDEAGTVRGLVKYRALDGTVQVGVTCALCHAGDGQAGRADRRLDIGWARAAFAEAHGRTPGVFAQWGPGRVDVSEDGVDAPFAIPDLWGVRHATYLNHSGSIAVDGPASRAQILATRFETQFIKGHRMVGRPNRTLVWALARYVESLQPAPRELSAEPSKEPPNEPAGEALFVARCGECHDGSRGFSGDLVDASHLTSDPTAALSPSRGTGYYKVPSLLGVANNAPYLHDGSQPSLDALLRDGHPRGAKLNSADRQLLIRFLNTL